MNPNEDNQKVFIVCPTCQITGNRQIIGEIKDGMLWVLRYRNAYTKIRGEFTVLCGFCNNEIYFRTERRGTTNEGTMYGSFGLSGSAFSQEAGTARA